MSVPLGPVEIVGIAWYRRSDWDKLRALFVDSDKLPSTWDDWERRATAMERMAQEQGKRVVRAEIRPKHFADWCIRTGRQPDADARMAWGSEAAFAEHSKRH